MRSNLFHCGPSAHNNKSCCRRRAYHRLWAQYELRPVTLNVQFGHISLKNLTLLLSRGAVYCLAGGQHTHNSSLYAGRHKSRLASLFLTTTKRNTLRRTTVAAQQAYMTSTNKSYAIFHYQLATLMVNHKARTQ